MKPQQRSSAWKTDPRAAYIPGAALATFVLLLTVFVAPAWSFEAVHGQIENPIAEVHGLSTSLPPQNPSSTTADTCLPLLKSIRHNTLPSAVNRNQRSAGKAAALGLVLGVRFALTPTSGTKSNTPKPRFDVWQPSGEIAGNRHALAVSAYRQCQKEQALKALGEFRWKR